MFITYFRVSRNITVGGMFSFFFLPNQPEKGVPGTALAVVAYVVDGI